MIILRYFSRELLLSTFVISFGLLLVIVGARFSLYLDQAANGEIAADVVFLVLAYRLPRIITLILPVGFFCAVLVAYGRMYVDNEMVVLSSTGFSKTRLLLYTLLPGSIMAAVVCVMSLYVTPVSERAADMVMLEQRNRSELEVLPSARFHQVREDNPLTIYFQDFADGRKQIEEVFIAELANPGSNDGKLSVVTARIGRDEVDPETGHRYLVLQDGYQYEGEPGGLEFQVTEFDRFKQFFKARDPDAARIKEEFVSTLTLIETDHPAFKAELQWRYSLPFLVLVLTLLAVPLSYARPRGGRYMKIVPGLVLVLFYMALLLVARNAVEDQKLPLYPGAWWVHGLYLALAAALLFWNNGQPLGRVKGIPAGHGDQHVAS